MQEKSWGRKLPENNKEKREKKGRAPGRTGNDGDRCGFASSKSDRNNWEIGPENTEIEHIQLYVNRKNRIRHRKSHIDGSRDRRIERRRDGRWRRRTKLEGRDLWEPWEQKIDAYVNDYMWRLREMKADNTKQRFLLFDRVDYRHLWQGIFCTKKLNWCFKITSGKEGSYRKRHWEIYN